MDKILFYWPWAGLFFGIGMILFLILKRKVEISQGSGWFAILLPLYMVHQFEEHGVDLFGHAFAFQAFLCDTIGFHGDLVNCPATPWFLMMVNVGTVWILGGAAAWFGSRRPFIGAAMNALLLTNGIVHIVAGIRAGGYNPGLASSLVIFLPVSIWIYRLWIRKNILKVAHVPVSIACGVLIHVVLMGSLKAAGLGWINEMTLSVIQILNALFPIGLGFLLSSQASGSPAKSG